MSKKNSLTTAKGNLYKVIDEILWQDWDPINMKGNGGSHMRNEYESYVPVIFRMRINNASINEIAAKLIEIESKSLGYTITPEIKALSNSSRKDYQFSN